MTAEEKAIAVPGKFLNIYESFGFSLAFAMVLG